MHEKGGDTPGGPAFPGLVIGVFHFAGERPEGWKGESQPFASLQLPRTEGQEQQREVAHRPRQGKEAMIPADHDADFDALNSDLDDIRDTLTEIRDAVVDGDSSGAAIPFAGAYVLV